MSKDGGVGSVFHTNCNNKGPTVTVVRSSSGHLFGAVAANSWTSPSAHVSSPDSFLFCLDCAGERDTPRKLAQLPGKTNAMYDVGSYGPTFGPGHDLYIANAPGKTATSASNLGATFECPSSIGVYGSAECQAYIAGYRYFVVSDYAVYVITATTD